MKTTEALLVETYDDAIELLRERIKDKSATAADITNLLRLLDKADILTLIRATATPAASASSPALAQNVPFPSTDDLDPSEFPELRVN